MFGNHFVRHGKEGLVGTGAALDSGLAAKAQLPFVAAGQCVTRLAGPGILPALRKHILPSAKEGPEQRDLLVCRRLARHQPSVPIAVWCRRFRSVEFGETGLERLPFGREPREAPANARGFAVMHVLVRQTALHSPGVVYAVWHDHSNRRDDTGSQGLASLGEVCLRLLASFWRRHRFFTAGCAPDSTPASGSLHRCAADNSQNPGAQQDGFEHRCVAVEGDAVRSAGSGPEAGPVRSRH